MSTALRMMVMACLAVCAMATAQSKSDLIAKSRNLGPGAVDTSIYMTPQFKAPPPGKVDHPLFRSVYMGSPDKIVARTSYGPVTEQDLWLWIILSDSFSPAYLIDQYNKAKTPSEREAFAVTLRGHINDYVFTNQVIPAIAGDIPPTECDLRAYYYGLRGYEIAYILNIVAPQVCISKADQVKYMQEHRSEVGDPARTRVRYILKTTSYDESLEDQAVAENEMRTLRESILSGQTTFAEAARANSDAPSAGNGGEIPAFARNEMFSIFQEFTAALKPGEVSEVFRGPQGLYMVQLIETTLGEEPTLENPVHVQRIQDKLYPKAVKGQFEFATKQLFRDRHPLPDVNDWDNKHDQDIVGSVGKFQIQKCNFWMTFPEIEREELKLDQTRLRDTMSAFLQREAMAQVVREGGFDNDPVLVRSREIAANMARRDAYVERQFNNLNVNEEVARKFWRDNPRLFTPLAMKRLVKLTLKSVSLAFTPADAQAELAFIVSGEERPTLPQAMPAEQMTTGIIESIITNQVGPGGAGAAAPAAGGEALWTEDEGSVSDEHRPAPRGIPILPLGYFPKIGPTVMREKVAAYKSSDFVLNYQDLGFVYLEDVPGLPASVDKVPVGDFSKPILEGNSAVSWYVEDARKLPKPAFEEIIPQVYTTYRTITVGKKTARTYDEQLKKANVRFSF
ncbi:hypothetical protein CVU37_02490 [candidate division BRC1 bacterium HGW-BRC1-1]|jgi:hypothetical protein|nr:MAG: hypothetical protein CVU37_02490 [candidate division BRC1 bacterium HGW-BRC1-1]